MRRGILSLVICFAFLISTAFAQESDTTTYTVQRGDTLFRIATRYHTTVQVLVDFNHLTNPNQLTIGQTLLIPAQGGATPNPTVPTAAPTFAPARGYPFGYGIEAQFIGQDVAALIEDVSALGMSWVKQPISWKDLEPVQGQAIDFVALDTIVTSLNERGLKILFTVSAAPAWARGGASEENGPPSNLTDLAVFLGKLANRYAGRVQAYEIWNEPNIRREWRTEPLGISATAYVALLKTAYQAIKGIDPTALVISAGLAPTGYYDEYNAKNDRLFLQELYKAGLADVSDAVGAHPLGWANPPGSLCCVAPAGVSGYYQDPSFYFRETLQAYRDIMIANGDGNTPIWVTKFGWGSSEDVGQPSESYLYMSYTSLDEQATYLPDAFLLGAEFGFVGPMFLHNLNGCQIPFTTEDVCYYSLLSPSDEPRPAFAAVQNLIKPAVAPLPQ